MIYPNGKFDPNFPLPFPKGFETRNVGLTVENAPGIFGIGLLAGIAL